VAYPFSEGRAVVEVRGLEAYIDEKGKHVRRPQFLVAGSFEEGLAPAVTALGEALVFIERDGRTVLSLSLSGLGDQVVE
jgi:hypothetical protein